MKGLAAINSVALCLGYKSREEMLELTKVDPDTIDDDNELTWPERRVDRRVTIEFLADGGFTVREGDRFCDRLAWDEMLGHIATMTMPPGGRMYPMVTKEEEREQILRRNQKRENRQTTAPTS